MKYLLASLLIFPATALAVQIPGDALFQLRAEALQRINESRKADGLDELNYSKDIERVAQGHADDTADHFEPENLESREASYLAHTSSDGKNLEARFNNAEVPTGWGFAENTGYWTRDPFATSPVPNAFLEAARYGLRLIHEGMMAEVPPNDSHRKSILGQYTHVGIGLSIFDEPKAGANAIFFVSDFSRYTSEIEEKELREKWQTAPSSRSIFSAELIPTHGGPFLDVRPSDPNVDAITELKNKNIIQGYKDGTFKPEMEVSRAEILKMLLGAVSISPIGKEFNRCFSDVFNQWYAPYVCLSKRNGWVTGYPDGSFKPAEIVTRAEGVTLAARIIDPHVVNAPPQPFNDVGEDSWFVEPVQKMNALNLLPFDERAMHPNRGMRRREVAEMLWRSLSAKEEEMLGAEDFVPGVERSLEKSGYQEN